MCVGLWKNNFLKYFFSDSEFELSYMIGSKFILVVKEVGAELLVAVLSLGHALSTVDNKNFFKHCFSKQ